MKSDRFRPDAAARRVIPIQRKPGTITTEEVIGWLDDPRVAGAVRVPGEVAGKRADRVIVDDPHSKPGGVSDEERAAALALFNPSDEDLAIAKAIKGAIKDGVVGGMTQVAGAALFEDHGPVASVGRRSFPRSHRGEGRNFVD